MKKIKNFIKNISKTFEKICDNFSSRMRLRHYRYNDLGALVVKLSLISLILLLAILGLTVALILL